MNLLSRACQVGWWALVAVVALLGAACAALFVPVPALICVPMAVGAVVFVMELQRSPALRLQRICSLAARVGAAAGSAVCALGLVALAGGSGLLLTALLAATSPWARSWYAERLTATMAPDESGAELAEWARLARTGHPGGTASDQLTDSELCEAWRASLAAIRFTGRPEERLRLAVLRQDYLDELERRDPEGFSRWLASGPHAAADPTRYLMLGRRGAA